MHELSICQSIVDSIIAELDAMDPQPKKLLSARIIAGELRQIVPDFLQDAYRMLTKDTSIEGSQLEIHQVPIRAKCTDCDWTGTLSIDLYKCAKCGSSNLKTEGGMELYLDNLEVER